MSDDWLELTQEDIERTEQLARANQLSRVQPTMSEMITILPSDIGLDRPLHAVSPTILTVTQDDLAPIGAQQVVSLDLQLLEDEMFRLVNAARSSHLPAWVGTANLKLHNGLAAVARGHSADMLRRQYVAHVSPEGISAARRIGLNGISYVASGENIGVYYGEGAHTTRAIHEIHDAFMNQPRSMTNHRGNLLNPLWTHIGIGIAHNPDGSLVATQNFISAPAARIRGR
ncbi:MAG TPA: CAP domain-containing protein [candidate division Zixibacteria bacterium]|nr:CAP domain-containing protein [candidate division Zixibacteria bacterium]